MGRSLGMCQEPEPALDFSSFRLVEGEVQEQNVDRGFAKDAESAPFRVLRDESHYRCDRKAPPLGYALHLIVRCCGRVLVLDQGRVVADGAARAVLGDAGLMAAHGLEVPWSLRGGESGATPGVAPG